MDRFVDILREELTGRDFKRIMKRIDEEMRDDWNDFDHNFNG